MFLYKPFHLKLSYIRNYKGNLRTKNIQYVRAMSSKPKLFLHPSQKHDSTQHNESIKEMPSMPLHFIHDSYNLFVEKKNHLKTLEEYVKNTIGIY